MGKNCPNISNNYIDNEKLTRLKFHILGTGYLKKGLSYFIEILTEDNNKVEVNFKELEPISDTKEEKEN